MRTTGGMSTAAGAALLAVLSSTARAEISFQGIGVAPGMQFSRVSAVSADGSTVAGWSSRPGTTPPVYAGPSHMIRWRAGALEDLGDLPPFDAFESADVNADGKVLVGSGWSVATGRPAAFRWTQMDGIVQIPVAAPVSHAGAVSADGSVVAGAYSDGASTRVFLWSSSQGVVTLPSTIGSFSDLSADGMTLVGHNSGSAYIWTEGAGLESLGPVPTGWTGSRPNAISGDSRVIVGNLERGVGVIEITPYRWTREGGYELLTAGPGDSHPWALATSADGGLVVGQMFLGAAWAAVIWFPDGSYRTIADYLSGFGVDTSAWVLTDATAISADGLTISGNGHRIGGYDEGWVATVPVPGPLGLALAWGVLATRRRR